MKQDATQIVVVLDRSGSMSSVRGDTIGGFNRFLSDHKSAPGSATFTLSQFDTEYEIVHDAKPIADIPPLTNETFVPRGGTALLDAIGRTMNATGAALGLMPEDQRPAKVIFVIITDGEENSSKEFTRDKIQEMIKHQREVYQWEFVFLGANQDAIQAGESIGVSASNSLTYALNKVGTANAFGSASRSTTSYRSGATATAAFNDDDKEAQKKAGA